MTLDFDLAVLLLIPVIQASAVQQTRRRPTLDEAASLATTMLRDYPLLTVTNGGDRVQLPNTFDAVLERIDRLTRESWSRT